MGAVRLKDAPLEIGRSNLCTRDAAIVHLVKPNVGWLLHTVLEAVLALYFRVIHIVQLGDREDIAGVTVILLDLAEVMPGHVGLRLQ